MNKFQLIKLYNEATEPTNWRDRADLALEMIRANADYLSRWYPKYESCERITLIDDLTQILFEEEEEDSEAERILRENLKGDRSKAIQWIAEEEERAFVIANRQKLKAEDKQSLLANHFRVYVVDEAHVDDCPSTYSDEKFKQVAEEQGFVFSLGGFEKQWNDTALDVDQDYHWIRIL